MNVNVVYACDWNMFEPLAVSMKSLVNEFVAGSSPDSYRLKIHVIAIGFANTEKELLHRIVDSSGPCCELSVIDHVLANRYPEAAFKYIELVTIKYGLPELLPGVDRVVWLDADTLILADITELWEVDLDGHWIGTTGIAACKAGFAKLGLVCLVSGFHSHCRKTPRPLNRISCMAFCCLMKA